jgi:hypothetical protein
MHKVLKKARHNNLDKEVIKKINKLYY